MREQPDNCGVACCTLISTAARSRSRTSRSWQSAARQGADLSWCLTVGRVLSPAHHLPITFPPSSHHPSHLHYLLLTCYSLATHLLLTCYSPATHLLLTFYSPTTHRVPTVGQSRYSALSSTCTSWDALPQLGKHTRSPSRCGRAGVAPGDGGRHLVSK